MTYMTTWLRFITMCDIIGLLKYIYRVKRNKPTMFREDLEDWNILKNQTWHILSILNEPWVWVLPYSFMRSYPACLRPTLQTRWRTNPSLSLGVSLRLWLCTFCTGSCCSHTFAWSIFYGSMTGTPSCPYHTLGMMPLPYSHNIVYSPKVYTPFYFLYQCQKVWLCCWPLVVREFQTPFDPSDLHASGIY